MLQPGTQIGRYEIQRRLGRGGMGTVYVAHDPVLGRMVAIKVFLSDLDLPDAAERFTREARAAAALNHANIVTIHDFGEFGSQPYIVMEYVAGETMGEVIRRRAPLPLADKLRWIEELCAGAAYAHRVGVIHRDIKPTNLMLDRTGRLKILDFGIARMLGGTPASNATALIGTPGYMAPEQILGGTVDHRADIFSIGVVSYELISYAEAFPGDTVPAITHRIVSGPPQPLAQVMPGVLPELAEVVERAIQKDAADRFPDAEAMREAINRVRRQVEAESPYESAAPASPHTPPPQASRPGTGSARQRTSGAVGVAELTPAPEPRRIDREALARRRAAQIDAALQDARTHLHAGDLDAAQEACVQALTLDDSHAGALELDAAIKSAIARQRAASLFEEAREELGRGALTGAQGLLQQARELDPDAPEGRLLERELRLARAEQERLRQRAALLSAAVDAARRALAEGELEAALASAREARELDPAAAEPRELEAEALRRLDEETGALGGSEPESTVLRPPSDLAEPTVLRPPIGAASWASDAPEPTIVGPSGRLTPAPPRATPTPIPGNASDARAARVPAQPSVPPADDVRTVVAPPGRRTPVPAASPPPSAAAERAPDRSVRPAAARSPARESRDYLASLRPLVVSLGARARDGAATFQAMPARQKAIAGGIAGAVLAVATLVSFSVLSPGAAPTGGVVLEALPWATVAEVRADDGTVQPLPALAATPLRLTLPAGEYQVRLVGPPPGSATREITVEVREGEITTAPAVQFHTVTPEEYFELYLGPGASETPSAAAPDEGAEPADDAPTLPPAAEDAAQGAP